MKSPTWGQLALLSPQLLQKEVVLIAFEVAFM